jgi:phosphate transport system substrate-binding protein
VSRRDRRRPARPRRLARLAGLLAATLASASSLADIAVPQGPHVEIRGTLAMGAVARAVAEQYMKDHPEAVVTVSGGGTYRGLKSVIVGTADVAMATDLVPDELLEMAASKHVTLESRPAFSDAVVVVVHPDNPIKKLSMRELRDVFSGKVTRWAELGVQLGTATGRPATVARGRDAGLADAGAPPEPDIVVLTLASNSSPYETFKKHVLGDDSVITPRAQEVEFGAFDGAVTEGAIGYTGLRQVGRLKALPIDGVVPSVETVRSGRYPIARQLSLWVRTPATPAVASVLESFLSDKGQRLAESLGNVPVK